MDNLLKIKQLKKTEQVKNNKKMFFENVKKCFL